PISAAIYSPLTTLLPPCLNNAATILDALISAHQGMRAFSLGYSQQANVVQDVAALHSLLEVGEEYLAKLGFDDVSVVATLYQWMNNFPADEARAMGVICLGAATAALAGAHQVIVKTPHEAWGVPTREANLAGLKATKQVLSMLRNQRWPETEEYRQERAQISRETRAILDRVLELGDGDVAAGTVRGIESGVVEICFSPHRSNAGRALGMNDAQGAVRFLDCGNLPFDGETREYHREKVEARVKDAGRPSYELMLDDVYAVSDAIAG
ncbi:MAG: methylaspartate mutase subunit E, partial [Chloroflexi bacterium]|nr:methylaspartate mutase subunit E [Chloroflexota bacterium]